MSSRNDFDFGILQQTCNRPWPLPERPWLMRQSWHDLLFAHWVVDVDKLRSRVPSALELETFGGRAWVGIVPFRMSNVAPRGVPTSRDCRHAKTDELAAFYLG
jgi:uncharacterized protein YqjF (DUF2071 family)